MSYDKIIECKNKIENITSWRMNLIHFNHRRAPDKFTCYEVNFDNENDLFEVIKSMYETFTYIIETKYNSTVKQYTGFNPKNCVDKLSTSEEVIEDAWTNLINSIADSDDMTDFNNIKCNAFIFTGTYTNEDDDEKNIHIICKRNPIANYKKKFFTSVHNELTKIKDPILQFPNCFDAVIFEESLYMINSNCELIFNLEQSHKKICKQRLSEIEALNLITDIEVFNGYALAKHNPRKFRTFDSNILSKICNPEHMESLCSKLHIPFISDTNQIDLSNEDDAINFINVICGRTKRDFFEETLYEVSDFTPLDS